MTARPRPYAEARAAGDDPLPSAGARHLERRQLGAYYTPRTAADYMADWVVRSENEHYLEPSLGDGMFLRAVQQCARTKGIAAARLSGVEIDAAALRRVAADESLSSADVRLGDFLRCRPFPVQAVIGNPPYVRLRALTQKAREAALGAASEMLGTEMDPSGSLWMPFVLHASRFLTPGGRLALVLPYELTYVRYARPLWGFLGRRFGALQLLRTHERLFADILQDVVILLADGYGESTGQVTYRAFQDVAGLNAGRPVAEADIRIADLLAGRRPFKEALLSPALRQLLADRIAPQVVPARELATFNIGYVAGDKTFFHPTAAVVGEFGLPERSLPKSLTSARRMRRTGIRTSTIPESAVDRLFLPDPSSLTRGERRYIRGGEESGVSDRYKCSVRTPWYLVPGVRTPDLLVNVFTERPVLRVNDAGYRASNSLLCAYLKQGTAEALVARWYTSLTLLMCELEVHSLGGGIMILVPREAGNVLLPAAVSVHDAHLRAIDEQLRAGDAERAYESGDAHVLGAQMGLSPQEIALIRDGIRTLSYWRTSVRTPAADPLT